MGSAIHASRAVARAIHRIAAPRNAAGAHTHVDLNLQSTTALCIEHCAISRGMQNN
jgi:hypothetical protein